ncbi:hypothetical protein EON83_07555 [bacterium]|nr:MAG: hypothetical protein EON83_07555 [bacterium]
MKFLTKKRLAAVGGLLFVGGGASLSQSTLASPLPLATATASVAISLPLLNDYQVPFASRDRLGRINDLLPYAKPIEREYLGLNQMLRLPDGTIFIDADLDTDADGSPRAEEIDPDAGQLMTAFNFPGEEGQRLYVDAEKVPYIVLPLDLYKELGVKLGDVAAVIWNGRLVYAVFADTGPVELIGEGSIALSEGLGFDPWEERDGRRQIVNGIEDHVLMLVFPNSANRDITPENINQKTIECAKPLFQALGGNDN